MTHRRWLLNRWICFLIGHDWKLVPGTFGACKECDRCDAAKGKP